MSTSTPSAAFAAVVKRLAPNADEAQHMVDHGGPAARTVGRAVLAAIRAGRADTEAGCAAFLAALAPAADEAARLAKAGNGRQKQVGAALLAAQAGAKAVDWHATPAEQPVVIAAVFGDLTLSAALPTPAAVRLERAGATDLAASCGWQATGPGAVRLARAAGPAVFAVGAADVDLDLEFAPAPGMAAAEAVVVAIVGPFLGLKPGTPASVTRRLLPPVVGPTRSVVSVAQGFDAVALSASAPTTAAVVLGRTGDTSAALVVPVTVSGLQDGDLAQPVGAASFAPGAPQASVTLQFGPGTAGAPDRAAHLAIDASGGAFDLGSPGGLDFAVREPSVVQPTKGALTFPDPIGTVLRDAAGETTVEVKVERQNVSTRDAATIPVVDVVLPATILKAVGPADFKAGSKYGYAPMVLHPYGAGARPSAVQRTPGTAALRTTPDFDLGTVPSQDFVVQDGQDVGPGGNPFHDRMPAEVLAVLGFPFGWSMNWSPGDVAAWTALTGRRPYVCSGGSHNGGRISTWDRVMGGPVLSDKAGYDSGGVAGSQLDYKGTNFDVAMQVIGKGAGLLVPTWWFTPDQGRGSYASLAGSAQLYDRAYGFGRRACAEMIQAGKDPGQLAPRLEKELNQDPSRAPHDASEVLEYAAAEATFIQGFNDGYTARQPVKPLFILGLARHDQIGPLENWVAKDPNDPSKALIAAIDISAHLPNSANGLAGRPIAEQAAGVRQWLRGGYDGRPCYSHDHADPAFNGKRVCQKYGLAMTNTETSPRNEPNMACSISAGFYAGMFGFWNENKAMIGGVGIFATSAIKPASIPGWGDGIAMLGRCAKGLAP